MKKDIFGFVMKNRTSSKAVGELWDSKMNLLTLELTFDKRPQNTPMTDGVFRLFYLIRRSHCTVLHDTTPHHDTPEVAHNFKNVSFSRVSLYLFIELNQASVVVSFSIRWFKCVQSRQRLYWSCPSFDYLSIVKSRQNNHLTYEKISQRLFTYLGCVQKSFCKSWLYYIFCLRLQMDFYECEQRRCRASICKNKLLSQWILIILYSFGRYS